MVNKTIKKDKDIKKKKAKAHQKINIHDPIETDKIKEDYMTIDIETEQGGIGTTIKGKNKEIDKPEEAEVEKKALILINKNLT
jgi:hypothetical protein